MSTLVRGILRSLLLRTTVSDLGEQEGFLYMLHHSVAVSIQSVYIVITVSTSNNKASHFQCHLSVFPSTVHILQVLFTSVLATELAYLALAGLHCSAFFYFIIQKW